MSVVLWGYYGSNYGDNIMMETLLDYFNSKGLTVFLVDMFGTKLEKRVFYKFPNIEIVPFYKYSKVKKIKKLFELSKADINIWGGGTIFTDVDGDGNYKSFSLIKRFGGKIGYVGVGIGNLSKKSRIIKTKQLLKESTFVVFREEKSYYKAKKIKFDGNYLLAEDLAYVYFYNVKKENKLSIIKKKYDNYLLITWRNLIGYLKNNSEKDLMDKIVNCIPTFLKKFHLTTVVLSALDTKFDIESCNLLYYKLREKGIEVYIDSDSSIENITNLIYSSKFHISGRLHGSIASEILTIPTLSMAYSPKMVYFYESINSTNYIDVYNDSINSQDIIEMGISMKKQYRVLDFNSKYNNSMLNFKYLDELIALQRK
jgi:polysaccharide pyruvyl transferase WcaK-like protein